MELLDIVSYNSAFTFEPTTAVVIHSAKKREFRKRQIVCQIKTTTLAGKCKINIETPVYKAQGGIPRRRQLIIISALQQQQQHQPHSK